jgi:molybdopterin-synthase adenylyltransferase
VSLGDDRLSRFARQLIVPGFGAAAQERLAAARVRVVGAGAVGSAALVALAQAGVGRIWIDDLETVVPEDVAGWLYPPSAVGAPRAESARAALAPYSVFTAVEPYPVGGVPDAALVCAPLSLAMATAEASRRAGIPHVVVDPDGEGGSVVTVPPGAPCYSCGRSTIGAGRPATASAAALGSLGALELVLLIGAPVGIAGRRVELLRGVTATRPTLRLSGCACAGAQPAEG